MVLRNPKAACPPKIFKVLRRRKKIRRKKYFKTPLVFTMNIRGEPACPRRQANCIQQVILILAHQKQKPNAFGKLRRSAVRVNKAGSSSLLGLFIQLAMRNKFVVVSRGLPKVSFVTS